MKQIVINIIFGLTVSILLVIMAFCSYNLTKMFEEGVFDNQQNQSTIKPMNNNLKSFSEALEEIKKGNKVARSGWNGKDMHIELQSPDENSKMTLPYIFMKTADGAIVPWLASQSDLLSEDWSIVN